MADFVSGFWNVYVMGLVALSLAFCVFVLLSNSKTGVPKGAKPELQGHVWDEDLQEYNNPLPRWWMYLFWITVIFAIVYLAAYPGFGNSKGLFGWSSMGQYEAERQSVDERVAPIFAKYSQMDLMSVATDPEANAMGRRLFMTYCAQCHGSAAQGARGFPNLTDNEWQWGGEPETVKATILNGRMGVMPGFGPSLGGEGVKDVANYVRSLSGLAHDSLRAQRGADLFNAQCTVCHGADAKGMTILGAPNLTDSVWLYGSSEATIIETIANGRNNVMPAFKDFLGEDRVHILSAYVLSLSQSK